jgi:hypothetical protein
MPDPEGDHRRRRRPIQQYGVQPRAADHGGRVLREHVRLVPGVVPDQDRAVGAALVLQVGAESGGGADHDHPVHPVRSGADGSAESRRTELEGAGEAIGQLGGIAGRQ